MKTAFAFFISTCLFHINFAFANSPELKGEDLLSGKPIELMQKESGNKGTVVVFLSAKCPCSNAHNSILKSLSEKHPSFRFLAVHSNADEDIEFSKKYFKEAALPFPVVQDPDAVWANHFRAHKTPHVFVVGNEGQLLYKGGVTSSESARPTDRQYLAEALEDIQNNQPVRTKEGRALGCVIARKNDNKNIW